MTYQNERWAFNSYHLEASIDTCDILLGVLLSVDMETQLPACNNVYWMGVAELLIPMTDFLCRRY